MGCWNETCMISHLPIYSGDRIVAIPIISSVFDVENTRGIYSSDYWGIFLPPVRGTYDDYGSIENTNDPVFESVARKFTKRDGIFDDFCDLTGDSFINQCIAAIGQNEYYKDFTGVAKDVGIPYLSARYGSLWDRTQVKVVYIHEDIFDKMIAESEAGKEAWKFIHEISHTSGLFGDEPDYVHGMSGGCQSFYPHHILLVRLLSSFGEKEVEKRMEEIIKFNGALEDMRMCYHPTTGSGSQDGMNEFSKEMREMIAETAKTLYNEENE